MKNQNEMVVAGIMSGSSLDGVDIVISKFHLEGSDIKSEVISFTTISYDDFWVKKLPLIVELNTVAFLEISASYSKMLGELLFTYFDRVDTYPDLISCHGHTIYHNPQKYVSCQIGSGAMISAITGIDTVCDFRSQDVALGGEGAPLAPLVEKVLFSGYDYYLNLGGIANISVHHGQDISGWDICPCNQALNYLAGKLGAPYDEDGQWARQGHLDAILLKDLKSMDYFHAKPPKSLDNNWITTEYLKVFNQESIEDMLFTQCTFIGEQVAEDINLYGLVKDEAKMLVTGGGAFNTFLVESIKSEIDVELVMPEKSVVESKEAVLIALMGYMFHQNKTNTLASVTGAGSDAIAGAYYKAIG